MSYDTLPTIELLEGKVWRSFYPAPVQRVPNLLAKTNRHLVG